MFKYQEVEPDPEQTVFMHFFAHMQKRDTLWARHVCSYDYSIQPLFRTKPEGMGFSGSSFNLIPKHPLPT